MSIIKAFVFDMDGVIFDTERLYQRAWTDIAKEYGISDAKKLQPKLMGAGIDDIRRLYLNAYGDNFPFDEYNAKVKERISRINKTNGLVFKDGAYELLQFLHENNVPTALATSTVRENAEKYLKSTGIFDFFDRIFTGDDITHFKPHPEIYSKACASLGMPPRETAAVEDSFNGIRSAHAAGLLPVMVPDTVQPDGDITELLYAKFNSLRDLLEFLTK